MSEFFFPISHHKGLYSHTYRENLRGLCKPFENAQTGEIVGVCYNMSLDFLGTATEIVTKYVIKTADPQNPLSIVEFAELDKVEVRNVSTFMVEIIHDQTLFTTFSQDEEVLVALEESEPGDTYLEILITPEFLIAYADEYMSTRFHHIAKKIGINQDTINNTFLAVIADDLSTSHAFVAAQSMTGALEAFGALALKDAKLHMSKEDSPDIGLPDLTQLRKQDQTS